MKYKNLLTTTTLIPLWAKAVESVSDDPILNDEQAYPILKSLGYDLDYLDKKKQNPSQVGCCLRAKWLDEEALKFIEAHESCQVIQLGAGIDDRFRRIHLPKNVVHWYDLDLEEVAKMRKEVIPEVERNEVISMNLFDTTWMERLRANGLPTLIIVEGVMMFLDSYSIRDLLNDIATHLGDATFLFDSVPSFAVGKAKFHDSVKKYNKQVEYTWGLKHPNDMMLLSPWVTDVEFQRMSDLPKADKFIWWLRWMFKIPFFYHNVNQLLVKFQIKGQL